MWNLLKNLQITKTRKRKQEAKQQINAQKRNNLFKRFICNMNRLFEKGTYTDELFVRMSFLRCLRIKVAELRTGINLSPTQKNRKSFSYHHANGIYSLSAGSPRASDVQDVLVSMTSQDVTFVIDLDRKKRSLWGLLGSLSHRSLAYSSY